MHRPPDPTVSRRTSVVRAVAPVLLMTTFACNALAPEFGVYPIEQVQISLPADLSPYPRLAVRMLQPSDAAFLDVAQTVVEKTADAIRKAKVFDSVTTLKWDEAGPAELELRIRVVSVRRVSSSDRFRRPGSGQTWVHTDVEVVDTRSRARIGAARLGGSSASDAPPKGTTEGAIHVTIRAITGFLVGSQSPESDS